ncbi:MAG TPA: bacillithiol biosynthesis cysteine-adding enzyme BshC [Thermaerobacter sp.]
MHIQPLDELELLYPDFFVHYLRDFDRVRPFFVYDPHDPEAFARRALALERAVHRPPREEVAEALSAYNQRLGAAEPALAAARRLADPRALAVVAGQQPGLATGPLYTVYKAVAAVRLARQLEEDLGRPVVPVFWLATEDHDLDECNRLFVVDERGELRLLRLPVPASGGQSSVGSLPLTPAARAVSRELVRLAGARADNPFARVLEEEREAARTFGEWAARLLARLFSGHGLVLLDPMEPALRRLARPLLQRAVVRRDTIHRELNAAAQRLERRGYRPQLRVEPEHAHLFYYDRGRRVALLWRDGEFTDRQGRLHMSPGEVARRLETDPESFSPNVVLRPIVQDWLLPTVAFITGPGETQYLAQLRDVYPLFGLEMPVIVPRPGFTLVAPEAVDRLHRYRVGVGEILRDPAGCRQRALAALDPVGIDRRFEEVRARIKDLYAELLDELELVRPELRPLGQQNLGRILAQVDYLHRKTWQHHRRRHRDVARDFAWLESSLRPGGEAQERVHNVFPYLLRYGDRWLRFLTRAPWGHGHQLVFLDPPAVPEAEPAAAWRGEEGR